MLQTYIGGYKNLGALLLLATVLGHGHGSKSSSENTSTSSPWTTSPMGTTGHNHSVSWTSQATSSTGMHSNSTSDELSNGTKAAVTTSGPGVTSSMDSLGTMAPDPVSIPAQPVTPVIPVTQPKNMGVGLFILILLFGIIVLLIIVIFCIRKKMRQYSFDLYGKEDADIPLGSVGQGGVFAPNQNDEKPADFEYAAKDEHSVGPGESEPRAEQEKRAPEDVDSEKPGSEDSFGSRIALTPNEKPLEFSFNLIDGEASQSSDTSTETLGEPRNENNNNTRLLSGRDLAAVSLSGAALDHVGPCEIFTDISLDEPV